jgi:4-amino-4-deoxy-L-arabinose transferase-like glycosyltransferase
MIATGETTSAPALVGRLEREQTVSWLSWLALACPLAVSAGLNLWNIAQNGYSNLYYSVAVWSMTQSWHNFFFASYDAGGFISVDKPPVALWIQAISAKIFGFNSLSLLVPEALAGVACVALVYFLVRRLFGVLAGFVAALAMATTPIAVAVDRTNGVDTWLLFTLLLAAWAITIATEKGRFALLALSLALVGVGFNIKMLAAFVVLPAFYLLYLVASPLKWQKRLLHLSLGSVVLLAVSLSWPLAVDLTPASQRPWVGGSQADSVLDLALHYNGLGRVTGDEGVGGPGGRGGFRPGGQIPVPPPQGAGGGVQPVPGGLPPNFGGNNQVFPLPPGFPGGQAQPGGNAGNGAPGGPGPGAIGPGGRGGGMFGAGFAGPLRLFFGGELAEQWSWLFPLAALGLVAAVLALRLQNIRTLPLRRLDKCRAQALLLWVGWLVSYGAVFSFAEGIFHPYYLIMLSPSVAALVGIGLVALWRAYRKGGWQAWLLPVALLATALWQWVVLAVYPQWGVWLVPLTIGGSLLAAVPLAWVRLLDNRQLFRRVAGSWAWRPNSGLLGMGVVALLVSPLAWAITPVFAAPGNASLPQAGPMNMNMNGNFSWTQMGDAGNNSLVSYLEANSQGYYYLVALWNAQQASSLTLKTGKPVLAAGGFMGSDPALTADRLAQMVADKQVRFVMGLGGMGMGAAMRGSDSNSVSSWIESSCKAIDPSLYQDQTGQNDLLGGFGGPPGSGGFMGGNQQLYDCAAP